MKPLAIAFLALLLASCSEKMTPPTFDPETTKKWQVGYPSRTESPDTVYAQSGGTVAYVNDDPQSSTNLGKFVIVEHTKMLTESGKNVPVKYYTLYAMLGATSVKTGQIVNADTKVGITGPTGKIAKFENGGTMLFALYTETENKSLDQQWGDPIKAYGKFWYDLERVLGGSADAKLTNTFDVSSYARTTLDALLTPVKPNGGDEDFGFTKYVVSALVTEYPSPITGAERKGIEDYAKANNLPVMTNHLYGFHFYLQQKQFKVAFLLQGTLLESFRKEVVLGRTIDLYLICGFYDSNQNALCLLVNDFNARN